MDRAVANVDWRGTFQECAITHLVSHAFDHLPLLMQTKPNRGSQGYGARGFKFEESWLLWDDCERTVKEAWNSGGVTESAIANTQEKIRGCGTNLHAWGSSKTHPDTEKIKKLQKQVERLNANAPTEESKVEFLEVSRKLDDLLAKQEIYWHQNSRVSWLRHGEKNTRFFHSKAS